MKLEKATLSSSEAGLAGWISSNDVTLFTMVLVVIVALFLHAKLLKGKSENELLVEQRELLNLDLTSTGERLAKTRQERDLLDARLQERDRLLKLTQSELNLTQRERDKLNADLLDSLQRIESLSQSIAALTAEKTALETETAALTSQKSTLEKQKLALTAKGTALTQETASLNERLAAIAAQLESRVKQLEDLEKQRGRLKSQADALDEIVAKLEQKLQAANLNLQEVRSSAEKQQAAAMTRIQELSKEAQGENARAEDYLARLRRAAELFRGLNADKRALQNKVTGLSQELGNAETRFQQQLALKTRVNRELVGLNGRLHRVAILFDASGSMKQQETDSEDRWAAAQKIATTWLAHLDVDECVLIVFSSDVRVYPQDGSLIKISGASGAANRAKMMAQLKAVEPVGWTNTLAALQKAYSYEALDTIILLSDGAPTNPTSGKFDTQIAGQIYTLCQQHTEIPINTIGLGNYFDQDMSTFLRGIARITGGTFRGR